MTQSPCLPELPKPRLLACPFCSGEGRETKEADSDWPSKCFMFIQCTRCGARTANVYGSGDPSEWADARHNWNQRLACYEAGSAAAAQAVPEGYALFCCPKHTGQQFTVAVAYAPPLLQICPHCDPDYLTKLAAPTQGAEGAAPQAVGVCPCGDRPAADCDEQWGPKCDMGNNAKHAKVHAPAPQAVVGEASELFAIANDLHGEFDKQTYDEKRKSAWDLPDDHEFSVTITAAQERALSRAIIAYEKRVTLTPSPTPTALQEAKGS